MALFLVQHGKSLPKEKDPDQGLSREGLAETQVMADLAVDRITSYNVCYTKLLRWKRRLMA